MNTKKTNIFVITHKDFDMPDIDGYSPILAGAEYNHAAISFKDNSGDNISILNHSFCELTAQYWVWRNVSLSKNVGFVHYRRFFYEKRFDNSVSNILSVDEIEKILLSKDIILAQQMPLRRSVEDDYARYHNLADLLKVRKILEKSYPEYVLSLIHI